MRTLAVLYREGDLDLLGDLSKASVDANKHFMINLNYQKLHVISPKK